MLFDFHQKQNAKKPGSVHATYLITGTRTPPKPQHHANADTQDGQDAVMQSSPPVPNSSAPQAPEDDAEPAPVRSVLLVKEEHLSQAKATFEKITGIHVYSLAAGGLSDLNSLTECNRKIAVECASEDPLVAWKQYGTIQNPNVKRRTQKRPPLPATSNAKEAPAKAKPAPALEKQANKASNEPEPTSAKATPVPEKNTDATKKKTATKPVTLKREASSIFKSFAKGANKAKKPASTESSAAPSPAPVPAEDESMGGMSDDDIDSAAVDEEIEVDAGTGKSRKDREADLKAMMDADDEEMEDVADGASDNALDAPKDEEKEESQESTKEEPKETLTVENGRRRGRRRVMKKKTVKDDEGYLGESIQPHNYMYSASILTSRSDARRSSMGVLFRGRVCSEESQTHSCSCF
jgi:DNA polymerase delta subunit 3